MEKSSNKFELPKVLQEILEQKEISELIQLIKNNKISLGIKEYEELIEYYSGAKVGEYDELVSLVSLVIKKFPKIVKFHARLIQIHIDNKQYELAFNISLTFIDTFPKHPFGYMKAGICLREMGELEKAINYFKQVPDGKSEVLIYETKAMKLLQNIDLNQIENEKLEAVELINQYMDRYPSSIKIHTMLIQLYIDNKDYALALSLCKTFKDKFPTHPFGPMKTGVCLREMNMFTEAIEEFGKINNDEALRRISEMAIGNEHYRPVALAYLTSQKFNWSTPLVLVTELDRLYFSNRNLYNTIIKELNEYELDNYAKAAIGHSDINKDFLCKLIRTENLNLIQRVFTSEKHHRNNIKKVAFEVSQITCPLIRRNFENRLFSDTRLPRHPETRRLRIAVCVSGQVRGYKRVIESWASVFDASEHDFDFYCCFWDEIGSKPFVKQHMHRYFSDDFINIYLRHTESRSDTENELSYYPLYDVFNKKSKLSTNDVIETYKPVKLDVVPTKDFKEQSGMYCMHYMIERCWNLIDDPNSYDLIVRIRPDKPLRGTLQWNRVLEKAVQGYLFSDVQADMHQGVGLIMGDQIGISIPNIMRKYCQTFSNVKNVNGCYSEYPGYRPHMSLYLGMLEDGVEIISLDSLINPDKPVDAFPPSKNDIIRALGKCENIPFDEYIKCL